MQVQPLILLHFERSISMKHQAAAAVLFLSLSAVFSAPSAAASTVPGGSATDRATPSDAKVAAPEDIAQAANISNSAQQQELTLDQANAWAQANSYTLKTAAQDLERKDLELKRAPMPWEPYNFHLIWKNRIPQPATLLGETTPPLTCPTCPPRSRLNLPKIRFIFRP